VPGKNGAQRCRTFRGQIFRQQSLGFRAKGKIDRAPELRTFVIIGEG
jgi:hypothetical protein